jgi:biofilm protein TabA
MILDRIQNAAGYRGLGRNFSDALDYLAHTDFSVLAPGRVEMDGERMFALVQGYDSKPREQGFWEAHRRYIDVQFIAAGCERMGYAPVSTLAVARPYAPETDLATFEGSGDFFTAPAGTFAVFFPQDAHMPGLAPDRPAPVRKVVVKIAV